MAFPTTPILDDFSRTEDPASTDWTGPLVPSLAQIEIAGGAALGSTHGGGFSASWWKRLYTADMEAYATMQVAPPVTGGFAFIYLRVQNAGTTSVDGYWVKAGRFSDGQADCSFARMDDGVGTAPTGGQPSAFGTMADWAAGDKFGARIVGNAMELWLNQASGPYTGWTLVGSTTDSTYTGPGYLALGMDGSNIIRIDDFGGTPAAVARSTRFLSGVGW